MNKIILFICILFFEQTYSQLRYIGSDGTPRNYEFLDEEKKPIPIGDRGEITGSPLLQDQWTFGILKLQNGNMFSDSSVNYSLYYDKLFFKRDENIYPIDYPVKEFFIEASNKPEEKKIYHFGKGFPLIDQNDYSTFYEILFDGSSIKFLKKEDKQIRVSHPYNGPVEREYYTITDFFVFFPKENKIVELGKKVTLKDLRKNLSDYSGLIDSYSSSHKLDMKEDSDLNQLFSFLDSSKLVLGSSKFQ